MVTPEGHLVRRLGGSETATYLRSSAKPFQALPLVEAGGIERFDLSDDDLALICASHSGAPQHVARAASLLERGGFTPQDLLCGAHPPLDRRYAGELRRRDEEPGALHNNCSGKHAGMLLACRLLELQPEGYIAADHPLQQRIRARVAHLCRVEETSLGLGIDGCSVPTFHMPLVAAARGWAALAAPRLAGLPAETAMAAERVLNAMGRCGEMVAGPGRFTTRLIEATGGRVVGKEGAEGVYCMAVRGPVALGVALKIADGADRARDGVALELLRQVGSLSAREFHDLEEFYRPEVRNHRELLVGRIVPDFELEEV